MRLNRLGALLAVALAACTSAPVKRPPASTPATQLPEPAAPAQPGSLPQAPAGTAEAHNAAVCRQTMQHDERNYTAGGLYAPDVADAHPDGELDISLLQEPMPRDEPKSRYGNKSPYTVLKKKYFVRDSAEGYKERGIASWYGTKFHGRKTSSQEVYDMCQFSAAHKTLPIPSYARVTRLDTGQSVIVRVNDRGPFHEGRVIDLSFAAASKLGINRTGTAKVEVEAISDGEALPPLPSLSAVPDKPYLQVASFSSEDNADALKERLQAAGLDHVQVRKHRLAGDPVWRVRIGPLGDNEMRQTERKLSDLGLKGLRVGAE
ncbi:MAG TPA: septal ring lytic transglycosylase RlpA family protein [Arenimonas sp.]|nr:septal ring lytic transglycosylase RlpA family protein [Arenimonas sp.]